MDIQSSHLLLGESVSKPQLHAAIHENEERIDVGDSQTGNGYYYTASKLVTFQSKNAR